jgi:hypothetical protein
MLNDLNPENVERIPGIASKRIRRNKEWEIVIAFTQLL